MKANIFEIYVKVYVGSRNRTLLPSGLVGKESSYNEGDLGSIPGLGRSSGKGNDNPLQYSDWKIPWMEEHGRLQSMGSQRVRHD